MVLSAAYRDSGEAGKADETRELWVSIVDSILDSGDGRSPATAFKVIDVQEEYAVLRIMRLASLGQSMRHHDSGSFDVMKVKSPDSAESFEIYFNINLPIGWMNRQLSDAK